MRFEGKVAVVTGSSRGIGRSIALELGCNGASVIVNYNRDEDAAREVASMIKSAGFHADIFKADVSKYNEAQDLIKFAIDGITSFSSVPLRLASWLGYFTSLFAFLYAINIFIQRLMGYTVKGLATVVIGMLFLGGVQLICLGIIGEYIGRIFTETKQRPMYVVENIYQAGQAEKAE